MTPSPSPPDRLPYGIPARGDGTGERRCGSKSSPRTLRNRTDEHMIKMHVLTSKNDIGESLNCIFPTGKSQSWQKRREVFLTEWELWSTAPESVFSTAASALLKDGPSDLGGLFHPKCPNVVQTHGVSRKWNPECTRFFLSVVRAEPAVVLRLLWPEN